MRKCKRCNKEFEPEQYKYSQQYCIECKYIKDHEQWKGRYKRKVKNDIIQQ